LTELLTAPVRAALFLIRGERQLAHLRELARSTTNTSADVAPTFAASTTASTN
jgi:hypothetical protein